MIQEFVDRFEGNKNQLEQMFTKEHPADYKDILKKVLTILKADEYCSPDPERIHRIDDGDYQGTLVFVVACGGYQPSDYWYVKVGYGSCSGCDTFEAIRGWDDTPTAENVKDYMTLALHLVQGLKKMGDDEV